MRRFQLVPAPSLRLWRLRPFGASSYFDVMVPRSVLPDGFVEPCIPALAAKPPAAAGWVHEIKHDGYRLIVRRDGETVRLFTRRGHDWTERYPAIATAAARLRAGHRTGAQCARRPDRDRKREMGGRAGAAGAGAARGFEGDR